MSAPAKFMFDECIGLPIMQRLDELVTAPHDFSHVCLKFKSGIPDHEWIPVLGKDGGWLVITGDRARKSNRGGKLPRLCKQYGITTLILSPKLAQKRSAEKLGCLLSMWEEIIALHQKPAGSQFQLRYRKTNEGRLILDIEQLKNL